VQHITTQLQHTFTGAMLEVSRNAANAQLRKRMQLKTATHCNALQHTAAQLQHTFTSAILRVSRHAANAQLPQTNAT